MKKICLNCTFCDLAFPDVDVRELKEEDDYLICTLLHRKETKENNTCRWWEPSKEREADIKAGC